MSDDDPMFYRSIDLGDGFVCETCGPAYEFFSVEIQDGRCYAAYAVSCYGGETREGSIRDGIELLEEVREVWPEYDQELDELREEMEALL